MGEMVGIVAGQVKGGGSATPTADWGGFGMSEPMAVLILLGVALVGVFFFLR